ncbi:hypothetical protein NIES4102_34290 [Chondrocystis sp. NIES-4102]|nr:hypothetical protein NIES4102_34290 [Chondrocystis sp. NIES-4102]
MKTILLGWEIILALLSFVFYKVMKFIIGNIYTIYLIINKKQASQWRVLSQKMINSPLILAVLMTKGPRWNTHATIGTLGPFSVKESIEIDIVSASKSALSWIAVVYSFPGYRTITSLESEKINRNQDNNVSNSWETIKLAPGKYSLGVRFYNRLDNITYPAIKVDKELFAESYSVPNNINDYYYDLIKAKNWFYSSLHYYIFTILKLRNYLPESFVRREFLPVGAPATHFAYNYLDSQQALIINIIPEVIAEFDIYFTLYDRSSLPLTWCAIENLEYQLPPQANKGYFLLRVRPKPQYADTKIKVISQLTAIEDTIQRWQISKC